MTVFVHFRAGILKLFILCLDSEWSFLLCYSASLEDSNDPYYIQGAGDDEEVLFLLLVMNAASPCWVSSSREVLGHHNSDCEF